MASQKIIHQDKKETAKCGFLLDEALDLKLELTNSCNGTINGRYTQWSNKMAHYVWFLVIFSIIYLYLYQVLFELFTWSLLQITIIVIKARIKWISWHWAMFNQLNIWQSLISTKSNTVYYDSKTSSELVIIDDLGVLSVIVTNNCWNPFLLWKTRLSRGFQTSEHYWERDALLWEGVSRTENNRPTHLYFLCLSQAQLLSWRFTWCEYHLKIKHW